MGETLVALELLDVFRGEGGGRYRFIIEPVCSHVCYFWNRVEVELMNCWGEEGKQLVRRENGFVLRRRCQILMIATPCVCLPLHNSSWHLIS